MRLLLLFASSLIAAITVAQTPKASGVADFFVSIHPSLFLTMSESSMERVHRRKKTKRS